MLLIMYLIGGNMEKDKVLIKLNFIEIDETFDVFIPVNEVVWKVKKLLIKAAADITQTNLNMDQEYILMNAETNEVYDNNQIIYDTNIRNATEIIMIPA